MEVNENAALLEATLRILLFVVALMAVVWLTARAVAARRHTFESSEPAHEREECTEEFRMIPTDVVPDDEPPRPFP